MNGRWVEQFARFADLLSRGNVFSTPKTSVKPVTADTPFIAPTARPTGLVEILTVQEAKSISGESKEKTNSKDKKKHDKASDKPTEDKPPVAAQTTFSP